MSNPYDDALAATELPPDDDCPPEYFESLLAGDDVASRVVPIRRVLESDAHTIVKLPPFALVGANQGLWAPLEAVTYDVGGIVPSASVVLLAGYSSSLKSWLALAMAFARASGLPWLGHEAFATERGAVTYLDREAGLYELRRRLHAIRKPLPPMPDPALDVCAFPPGNVFDPDFRRRLHDLAATRAMVFVDTLAAFAHGVDENSAQMAEGVGLFAEVASGTKCTFVVVAHEKKKGTNGGEIDPRERVRGSSAIFGAVDVVLSCQRSAPREPVEVVQTKARNGREADPFSVSMLDAPGGGVTFEVSAKEEPREQTPTERLDRDVDRVVALVRENPRCAGPVIREALRMRKESAGVLIARAIEQGRIRNLGTEKAPALVAVEGRS